MANSRVVGGEIAIEPQMLIEKGPVINIEYSSGRAALYCILRNIQKIFRGDGSILIPDYLCDSITNTIADAGWKYSFYHIDEELNVDDTEKLQLSEHNAVLLINYFGLIDLKDTIRKIKKFDSSLVVIEDDVQAFYSYKESAADYSFTSLRKWFSCPEGAFIKTSNAVKPVISDRSMFGQYKIAGNLLKSYSDIIDDSIYLELLKKGEELLDDEYLTECSHVSQVIFSNIDLKEVEEIRKNNAKILHEGLEKMGVKHLYKKNATPLFIPIFVDDRSSLRSLFFKNNIFTPVHWPHISVELNGTNEIYNRELSLICDQRYNENDMERQLEIISQFMNREGEKHGGNDS